MDWNGNLRPFLPQNPNFGFLYNFNYDPFSSVEVRNPGEIMASQMDRNTLGSQDKKRRLTAHQLELLESSFQEEMKLNPERKLKLARELGLEPRQVAIWFQNRRASWKAKQLEQLYEALKQEYDVISREKQKLQEEVFRLKTMLMGQAASTQPSTGYTEISGDETVESTSVGLQSTASPDLQKSNGDGSGPYLFNAVDQDQYSTIAVSPSYWGVAQFPRYP